MDGQVVFPRVLQFSPTFDEQSARYKWNIKKKQKKKNLLKSVNPFTPPPTHQNFWSILFIFAANRGSFKTPN